MPEFGQQNNFGEIQRPAGTAILPDDFIEEASSFGSVEELGKYLDEFIPVMMRRAVADRDESNKLSRGFYAIRKERTWAIKKRR